MTSPPANPTLPSLSSLRFLAAVGVFLAHGALEILFTNQLVGGVYLFSVMPLALAGVSYFFILSGFVLTWSHRSSDTAGRFWRRRFFRIFPNHLVAFLLALGLLLWAGMSTSLPQILAQLFLVHAWIPDPAYFNTINNVSWSLSVELFCYLLFPFLLMGVRRIRAERLWLWARSVVALVVTLTVVSDLLLPERLAHPLGDTSLLQFLSALKAPDDPVDAFGHASVTQVWFVYDLPIVRALEFFLGMLLARIVLSGRWIDIRPRTVVMILSATMVGAIFVPYLYQLTAVAIVPVMLLVGTVAVGDARRRPMFLQHPRLVRLGDLTFAFYLVHGLVLTYGHLAFGSTPTEFGPEGVSWPVLRAVAFLVGAFVGSLLLAWLLHTFVEKPAMRWSRPRPRTKAVPDLTPAGSGAKSPSGT